ASDQVAAFIGIQPVAGDPGQPTRLALNETNAVQQAAVEPIGDVPQGLTSSATVELPPEPVAVAAAEPAPVPEAAPVAVAEAVPPPVMPAAAPAEARPALSPAALQLTESYGTVRKAPKLRNGKSRAVVQIGAFSSRDRVAAAWSKVAGRHGKLK